MPKLFVALISHSKVFDYCSGLQSTCVTGRKLAKVTRCTISTHDSTRATRSFEMLISMAVGAQRNATVVISSADLEITLRSRSQWRMTSWRSDCLHFIHNCVSAICGSALSPVISLPSPPDRVILAMFYYVILELAFFGLFSHPYSVFFVSCSCLMWDPRTL